jgi:hypothetical protein
MKIPNERNTSMRNLIILMVVISSFFLLGGNTHAWWGGFADAVHYRTGDHPWDGCTGDFDNDGDLDISTCNMDDLNISVLMNNGDGTFQWPPVSYPFGDIPRSIYTVDLDGDFDLDLAATSQDSGSVGIFLNNGNGVFQEAVFYPVGRHPTDVNSGDFDNDNDMDLVVVNYWSWDVVVLFNNGDGTFQAPVIYPYPEGTGPHAVFVGDLDGDNDLDLAVADKRRDKVFRLFNNGDGSFQMSYGHPVCTWPGDIYGADFDNDSDIDLVVGSDNSDTISVLLNRGDGTFSRALNYPGIGNMECVHAYDCNGDGFPDLFAGDYGGYPGGLEVSVFLNNGDGTFQPAVNHRVQGRPNALFSGDYDLDGYPDLAVVNSASESISILRNLGFLNILNVTRTPHYPGPDEDCLVSAFIYGNIDCADLYYMAGDIPDSIRMDNVDDSFYAVIPGQPANTAVYYYIETMDSAGRTEYSDTSSYYVTENSISVGMTPVNPPIVVAPGGHFYYYGCILNHTPIVQIYDVWLMMDVPGMGMYGPGWISRDNMLKRSRTYQTPRIRQEVPVYAPAGDYTYIAYCGKYPDAIADSTFFTFTVTGFAQDWTEDWNFESWFEDEFSADEVEIPSEISLLNNYPNPFNAVTTISYDLPAADNVRLEIYNLMGQKVEILADDWMEAGNHSIQWNAEGYSSGIYFYKLTTGDKTVTKRMTLLK